MFATENDSEPPACKRFDWRMDPECSYSDWTVEIVVLDLDGKKNERSTYHVHKGTLAVACSYFAKLFRNSYAECETSTSKITLVKEAADAFPPFWTTYTIFVPRMKSLRRTTPLLYTTSGSILDFKVLPGRLFSSAPRI